MPSPSAKHDEGWDEINNDKWINDLFSAIHQWKLCMSNGLPMAPGGINHDIIEPQGTSTNADRILKGTFNVEEIQDQDGVDMAALQEFVKQMTCVWREDGSYIPDMKWKFEAEDCCNMFLKKNEETNCRPSGLHIPHWKAICSNDNLCNLFTKFIEIPYKLGFTYKWRETSYQTMIMKKSKPWANAMRIVQLPEGDYNAGLQYLIQQKVIGSAEKEQLYGESTYGGRKGKITHQVPG